MANDELESFRALLSKAASGSNTAIETLLRTYGPHVLRVVRKRMKSSMRKQFDSADLVQAVWASFFVSLSHLQDFDRPEALIGHLVTLARNKVIDQYRRQVQTQKRAIDREQQISNEMAKGEIQSPNFTSTPSQIAIANERWEAMLAKLPLHYQRVLYLALEGHTQGEIADEMHISDRTVRRILSLLPDPAKQIENE